MRDIDVASDRRIEFRVGIYLDDVIVESDGDLMGDGVNIGARLESIANRAEFVFRKMHTATCAGRFLRRSVTLVSPGPTSGSVSIEHGT